MVLVDEESILDLPEPRAFELMTHWEWFLDKVDPDVIRIERSPEGPVGPGTVFIETLKTSPVSRLTARATVTSVEAPKRMAFDIAGPGLEGDGFISCDAMNDEQTRVRTPYEAKPRGWGWLLMPLLSVDLPRHSERG